MRLLQITIAVMLFTMHGAYANTYYVSLNGDDASGDGSSGKPWRTLKAAVAKVTANQGHTIKLLAGTFVESGYVIVPTGVNIEGSGIGVTILKPSASLYYKSSAWLFDKFLLNFTGGGTGNQSVKALTIDGDSKQLYGGIVVKDRNNVLIQNVRVQYTYYTGIWMWNTVACRVTQSQLKDCAWGSSGGASGSIQLSLSENLEIDHLDVDENYGQAVDAISAGRMYYLKMHDNRFSVNPTGNWQTPGGVTVPNIAVEFYNVDLKGCQVYNNYFDNNFSIAMDEPKFATPTGVQTIRVYNNTFDLITRAKGAGHCVELTLHDAEVDHNYFYGGSTGIANWDASANPHTMHNWSIHHNTFYGISSYYPSAVINMYRNGIVNAHIYNNTVETNGTATVNFLEVNNSGIADNVRLENNLIIDSNTSYQWYPNKFISLANNATMRNSIARNNFFQKMAIGSVAGVSYSANSSGDPKIEKLNARPSYYELLSSSPCIDKGINIGSYSGAATDIGAFEFSSTSTSPQPVTSVLIMSPANNATFNPGATITIAASASTTSGSISKVEFFNGTTKLGEDTSSPFSFSWVNVVAGIYQITAHAISSSGQTANSSNTTVNVKSGNLVPTISITDPSNNASFSAGTTIPIAVFATDGDGQITKVEFFNGTTKLGEDTSSPHTFNWANVQAGTYQLIAKTTDNVGAVGTSAAVTITVGAKTGNQAPTATITSPGNNATFGSGVTIPIKVTATDLDGQIAKVEFFNGTTKIGGDVSSPYGFNWSNAQVGTHQLTVRATDNLGTTTVSSPITVTVKSNLTPTVSITSPVNNATFASGTTITISVFATDKDGQIVKVMFFNGSAKLGEDLTSPHSFNWANVPAGTYQVTAKTIDNLGAIGISAPITINVKSATTARISAESVDSEQVNESDLTVNIVSGQRARVFSPNNDGINDVWTWFRSEDDLNCSIAIYDRSGRRIFQNDGMQRAWDGTFNGAMLPDDIYYYETNCDGDKKTGVVRIVK